MSDSRLPYFPYGAVYFRKSNPPREDWARDYKVAAEDGMNTFRHWFLWSAIEVAPGKYDFSDYDRHLDLAAENGMKTIIAEMVALAPEWAYRKFADARYETRQGRRLDSGMHVSCVTGGTPGLCLDNDNVRKAAGDFLQTLADRYKDHPGLGGYDIWNECNYSSETCYCPATAAKFREWLRQKYGDLKVLGEVWHRYSFAEWDDVMPPRQNGPYPDVLDWLEFRIDNAYELMNWRVSMIRSKDASSLITAHGVAASLTGMAPRGADDWRAANEVESYGYTWGSSRHGDEPWKQWHAVDLVRSASRKKPFWHAEAYAGPLWMQPQVIGKPRFAGRIARPEDAVLWNLQSFAAGATGLMYLRWRPLLDGPLFGAFGPYAMDGSRTERSAAVSKVAKWVNQPKQKDLWESRPVKGDIGILYVPESQLHCYAQQDSTEFYSTSMEGAYQGFFDNNIQADWVHIEDIEQYDLLYLPYPVMLKDESITRLIAWVGNGGTLVSEGCPGYFGNHGRAGVTQPNRGLEELFGARETYVEFTPDLLESLQVNVDGLNVSGGIFLQAYEVLGGSPVGRYADAKIAAVDNTFGRGKTRLVGTFPGAGYAKNPTEDSRRFFAGILDWAGKTQHVKVSDNRLTARVHAGEGGTYLWITNPTENDLAVELRLSSDWSDFSKTEVLWGMDQQPQVTLSGLRVKVERRNGTVIRLCD